MTAQAPVEAEQALLGSILLDARILDKVAGVLKARDFVAPEHSRIFSTMMALRADGADVCYLSILQRYAGQKADLGGIEYLQKVDESVSTSRTYETFLGVVMAASKLRRLRAVIQEAGAIVDRARPEDHVEAYTQVSSLVFGATSEGETKQLIHIKDAAEEAMAQIRAAFECDGAVSGTSTGLDGLDDYTTGFYPGELLVLAGRPGMGKTTLALNIAQTVSRSGRPVAIFSLEMPAAQLATKLLTEASGVSQSKVRSGTITNDQVSSLVYAKNRLEGSPLWIYDSSACTTSEIQSRCRQIEALAGQKLGLIVLDYLQLMRGERKRGVSREQEVSALSRELKIIARQCEAPVLALSQLNRGVEARPDKRPLLSDLRESGAIEQDADAVFMIFRPGYYEDDAPQDLAELIIAKQRRGRTGSVNLRFDAQTSKFTTWVEPTQNLLREWT